MAVAQRLQNALDGDISEQIVKMLREDAAGSAKTDANLYDRPGIKHAIFLIEKNFINRLSTYHIRCGIMDAVKRNQRTISRPANSIGGCFTTSIRYGRLSCVG